MASPLTDICEQNTSSELLTDDEFLPTSPLRPQPATSLFSIIAEHQCSAAALAFLWKMSQNLNTRTKSDVLLEFLEVAFHSILYIRNIYPKSIFCLKKKYQIPVHVSKHPEVNNYITECLKTAQELLTQDGLKQIAVVIVTEFDVPLEKYCFDLETSDGGVDDFYFVKTEETFRQYLLKLSVASLNDLPENCSFRVQFTTTESCSVRLNENSDRAHFPWIEAEKEDPAKKNFEIFPIKTLDTSFLTLNMYVER